MEEPLEAKVRRLANKASWERMKNTYQVCCVLQVWATPYCEMSIETLVESIRSSGLSRKKMASIKNDINFIDSTRLQNYYTCIRPMKLEQLPNLRILCSRTNRHKTFCNAFYIVQIKVKKKRFWAFSPLKSKNNLQMQKNYFYKLFGINGWNYVTLCF